MVLVVLAVGVTGEEMSGVFTPKMHSPDELTSGSLLHYAIFV